MSQPEVKLHEWIEVSNRPACVLRTHDDGGIFVGYCQYRGTKRSKPWKAVGEEIVWKNNEWQFKSSGPDGTYLRGKEERIVIDGHPRYW